MSNKISRRTVAAGAAWSIPAVAVATAVPAFATSPSLVRGINGWVTYQRSGRRKCTYTYDGTGTGVGDDGLPRGLFAWPAESASDITKPPTMTFHLPQEVEWKDLNPGSGWSLPEYVGRDADDLYTYRSTYRGGYRQAQGREPQTILDKETGKDEPALYIVGRPIFQGTASSACTTDDRQAITRCIGLKGEQACHTRRKRFNGSYWNARQGAAVQPRAAKAAAAGAGEQASVS